MKAIFPAGAVTTMPAKPTAYGTGWATDAGAGTVIGAYTINQIFAELGNVIAAAGMTPSEDDLTQVSTAISLLITNGTSTLTSDMATVKSDIATLKSAGSGLDVAAVRYWSQQ